MRRPYRERLRDHPRRARRRRRRPRERHPGDRSAAPSRRCARPTACSRSSADQNQVLGNLTRDADAVIGDLADNRKDVGRFVTETRQTRRRLGRAARRDRRQPAPPADLPAQSCEPTMAQLGAGGRRADARRSPTSTQSAGQLATLLRAAARLRRRQPHRLQVARPSCPRTGARRCAAAKPTIAELNKFSTEHARARQQPRDRPRAPRRPRARGREGPALARRQGLHGLRGAPPVRLRPDDGDQHLRLQRLHAEGEPLPVRVLGLPEPRLAEGEAARRTRPSTSAAPPSSARTSPASRSADPTYTGAQKGAERHLPAAKKKRQARRAKARQAAGPPSASRTDEAQEARRGAGASGIEETLGIELPELPAGPDDPRPADPAARACPAAQAADPPRPQAAPRLPARAHEAARIRSSPTPS